MAGLQQLQLTENKEEEKVEVRGGGEQGKEEGDFDEPSLELQGSISTLGNPSEIDESSVEGSLVVELPSAMNMAQNIENYITSSRPSSTNREKKEVSVNESCRVSPVIMP